MFPIIAELQPGFIDEDTFQQYLDIGGMDDLPIKIPQPDTAVASVIHGHKRLRAAWLLGGELGQHEDGYLYAKVLPPGTFCIF
jgi:hypothetical protein